MFLGSVGWESETGWYDQWDDQPNFKVQNFGHMLRKILLFCAIIIELKFC